MKRKLFCLLMALCMMTTCVSAMEILDTEEYTDAASIMTQDSVLDLEVTTVNPVEECGIVLQLPGEESMELLNEVFDFVWVQKNRPVRFYDKETQQKVQALIPGVDIDTLHLTEFMGQTMHGEPTEGEEVVVERLLDVDYQAGQLAVVVLGYEEESGEYRWHPYLAEVPQLGLIRYAIPAEEYNELSGRPQVIYQVLTTRIGERGGVVEETEIKKDPVVTPSKAAEDIEKIEKWYSETGAEIEDDFRIYLVDQTKEMTEEVARIGRFIASEDGEAKPVINWFPEERVSEAQLLLGENVELDKMIVYDAAAVMQENYKDTYGDVAAECVLSASYSSECRMFVMLGFERPQEELEAISEAERDAVTHFDWYVQRAEAGEDVAEIVFKQLALTKMDEEPALILVFSEPLE